MTSEKSPDQTRTSRRVLSTRKVVFLVIAAAAPMSAMVGNVPLALIRGNGVALPAAFVLAAGILLCFSVGYAAMNRRVVNSGAFYTYIARALGKPAGVAGAYVALIGYASLAMGVAGAFGYFMHLVAESLGADVPWWAFAAFCVVVVGLLGYRNVDLSAKVLGTLMVLEFGILLVFNLLVVLQIGADAFPVESFSTTEVASGTLGISLMFALTSFIGFESAAIYGEEAVSPERTIPRAIYISVTTIAIFYVITAWIIIGSAGGTAAPDLAERELGDLVFTLMQTYGGETMYNLSAVLMGTSLLAASLAVHNAASRYLFALAREGVAPGTFSVYHPRHLSPHRASLGITLVTVVVLGTMAALGADPYTVVAASLVGLGTLAIILVQAATALAVLVFFWRRPDRDLWKCVVCPVIATIGLGMGFVLSAANYDALTGSTIGLVNAVPLLLIVAAGVGAWVALRLKRTRPSAYAVLASSTLRGHKVSAVDHPPVDYRRHYCLVGGGPASMVMARQLMAEGVPFDWFERNADFGGIWDMNNAGTPMYSSAHFISSKYTSGFYGYPMPESLPDYPNWQQIRDYIRAFAREFGLYDRITFNTDVLSAEPFADERWRVRLSDGTQREYDGLICAPGVTWHPNPATLPGQDEFRGTVRHSVSFKDGLEFRGKRVLIVGAGNSGVDIACDAARHADQAFLSVRRGYRFFPKHIGGLPTDAVVSGVLEPPRGISLSGNLSEAIDALVGDLTRLGLPKPDHDALASHPIMNTQVLHHLAHGDVIAKGDVDHLTQDGVVFVDGSTERIDEIILATGYEYRLPFLDPSLLTLHEGHPQLYLNVFSREHDSLAVLGFAEFADAAYRRFDEMAQLITMDIRARETGVNREELKMLKRTDHPDLRGGMAYVDSPRHANYVEVTTYRSYLAELRDRFGWPDLDEHAFDGLRTAPADALVTDSHIESQQREART